MKYFHGYTVVAATFLLNFVSIGTFNSAALFVVPLERSFSDVGRGTVDFLPTIYLAVALFTAMGAGWLQDTLQKAGARIEPVFGAGALCFGLGAMISSAGKQFSNVLAGAIVTGIGIGLTGFTAAGICVLWFQESRGTMLLLAMAGQGLGGFVYCNVMQQMLNFYEESDDWGVEYWRPAMKVTGIFSMIIAIVSSFVMRLPEDGEVEEFERGSHDEDDWNHSEAEVYKFIHDNWDVSLDEISEEDEEKASGETTPLKSSYQSVSRDRSPGMQKKRKTARKSRMNRISTMSRQRLSSVEAMSTTLFMRQSTNQYLSDGDHSSGDPDHKQSTSSLSEFEALARISVNFAAVVSEESKLSLEELTDEGPVAGLPYLSTSQAFYTRTSLALLGWCFFSCFAYINYVVHLPAFAESVGLSPEVGAAALSLTGLTMLLGNITLGRVTDVVGSIRMLQITMNVLMLVFFVWPYGTDTISLTTLAGLYGYAATTQGSVPLIIMADAFDSTSPDSILTLLGVLNFAKFPGYLFGPTICGTLYEKYGDYFSSSLFTGIIMLTG